MNKQRSNVHALAWEQLATMYAFAGNSFLSPMTTETALGLSPDFWETLPTCNSEVISNAAKQLATFAQRQKLEKAQSANMVQEYSVEYTRLFIGPPRPAVAPWETMYAPGNNAIGYGAATIDMKRIIAAQGLQLQGAHNQYEDHIGVELLLLSVLCTQQHESELAAAKVPAINVKASLAFLLHYLQQHPGSWIKTFAANVVAAAPGSYYALLATWVKNIVIWHLSQMELSERH